MKRTWRNHRNLERETENTLQAFKAAQKSKRALNTLRVLFIIHLVLFVVKSLHLLRAFIVLKCVTLFVLREN